MKAKFGMSMFINIVWLFVGGITAFWIGVDRKSTRLNSSHRV